MTIAVWPICPRTRAAGSGRLQFYLSASEPPASHPPPGPRESCKFAGAPRPQGHDHQYGAQQPARMTPDAANRVHAPVRQCQWYAPGRHVLRQRDALCGNLRYQLCTTFGQLGEFAVHDRSIRCCRSLDNSARLAANNFGLVLNLYRANQNAVTPPARNVPVSPASATSRWLSQKMTATKIASSTTPTPRQNKATNSSASTDTSRSRSSSRSVDNRSSRVCTMVSSVAANPFRESNNPDPPPGDSMLMGDRLTAAHDETDKQRESGGSANRFPRILVNVDVGRLGGCPGPNQQCGFGIGHLDLRLGKRRFGLGTHCGQRLAPLIGRSLDQGLSIRHHRLEVSNQLLLGHVREIRFVR